MTVLTVLTVIVVIYGVLTPKGYGRALALGGATPAGAAVAAGTTAVPTFYAVGLGTVVALGMRLLGTGASAPRPRLRLPPGVSLLVAFLAWSVLVTILAPQIFAGTAVLTPAGAGTLRAGVVTSSNVAQVAYLVIGVCVVVFLARSRHTGPEIIGLAVGATVVLSLWRYVGVAFPSGVFDNSPSFAFIETAPGGGERFRGILSEPSALAASCLVATAYMLPRAAQVRGWRRAGALAVAGIAAYLGTISTSATFVVAAVVVAAMAGSVFLVAFSLRRTRVSAVAALGVCAAGLAALAVVPGVAAFVNSTVEEKVTSSSFGERSGANTASYQTFLDTFGVGTGLGANRASSFLPGLLSTTGLIGTLLFAAAVITLLLRSLPDRRYLPVIWALLAMLVLKIVAGPDLSDSSGVLWMSLGLLSRAALQVESRRRNAARTGPEATTPATTDRAPAP